MSEAARKRRKSKRMRRLYLRYKNAGRCTYCRREKQRPGHFECEACAAYRRQAYHNRQIIEIRNREIYTVGSRML
jgi:hypothetical protein